MLEGSVSESASEVEKTRAKGKRESAGEGEMNGAEGE